MKQLEAITRCNLRPISFFLSQQLEATMGMKVELFYEKSFELANTIF